MLHNKPNWKIILISVLVLTVFLLPLVMTDPYYRHILIRIFIWIILALGARLMLVVGEINLAQAGFMGMGAYGVAILTTKLGWSFWLALPVAGIISGLLAVPIGYPLLRIRGVYFVMVTFAVSEVFRMVWKRWEGLFGGPSGILHIPRPNAIPLGFTTIEFVGKAPFYYLALILMLVTIVVMYAIDRSRVGLIMRSIRQADLLSEGVGINIMRYKLLGFVIGSFFAGIAGGFQASYLTSTSPYDYTWMQSLYMLLYAVVGGTATVLGPIVGSCVLVGIEEALWPLHQYVPIFLGAILIAVLLSLPRGLISIPERIRSRLGDRNVAE